MLPELVDEARILAPQIPITPLQLSPAHLGSRGWELLLGLDGHTVSTAQSPRAGLELLAHEAIDLVIQDMNFSADTTSGEEVWIFLRVKRGRWRTTGKWCAPSSIRA